MNIYVSGIGGVGLGPLAEIALDAGHAVVGSDMQPSPTSLALERRGVTVSYNQDGSFLREANSKASIDWFVHTAALPVDHPELQTARELGIKISKRDELLGQLIEATDMKLVAIAGTHGKTTTTAMVVWALKNFGIPVSYSVGAGLPFAPSGHYEAGSEFFVYECDEFDRNFLHFSPYLSLITSIDYDHPDTYPSEADYLEAFHDFGTKSRQLITWSDQHEELFLDHSDAWILHETLPVELPGLHNRRNATLAAKGIEKLGLGGDALAVLAQFPGTSRRFEKLATNLYSDYGHHPAEIAATLQMARELSDHVVLVYQPHQNIRQHQIREQYTNCFELAEEVYWLPTYLSREDPELPVLTPSELTSSITNRSAVHVANFDEDLWEKIGRARDAGKLVLCMGAGSIDGWLRSHLG